MAERPDNRTDQAYALLEEMVAVHDLAPGDAGPALNGYLAGLTCAALGRPGPGR